MLQQLRIAAEYSQAEFAYAVGLARKSSVSLIETGRNRIPRSEMSVRAKVLGIDLKEFVTILMPYQDPAIFEQFSDKIDLPPVADDAPTHQTVDPDLAPEKRLNNAKETLAEVKMLRDQLAELSAQIAKMAGQLDAIQAPTTQQSPRRSSRLSSRLGR